MQRLSSAKTVFYKRIFPIVWFGFIAFYLAFSWWAWLHPQAVDGPPIDPMFLLMPLVMAGMGFVVFRWLMFDLMDEVWLDSAGLLFKNRHDTCRVPLADVINVNATIMTNPRRVTVMTRTETRFGSSLSFAPASPRGLLGAFKLDPVALDLIKRVDAARQAAR